MQNKFFQNKIWKNVLIYLGIVLLFLVLSYLLVPQVLSGKIVNQGDISSWKGMSNEAVTYNAAHPEDKTRWTDSMFGGMPTTGTIDDYDGDWTKWLYDLLLTGRRPATYFFIALLGGFLLLLSFGAGLIPAVGGAVAIAFCSYNMQIIQVGHNTKMQAIAYFPWVLAAVVYTYRCAMASPGGLSPAESESRSLSGTKAWLPKTLFASVLFALALSFQIKANHPQITYYLAIVIFIYALTLVVWTFVKKDGRKQRIGRFFTASALLLTIGCIGIATNANKLLPVYEYSSYTMRGGSELAAENASGDASAKGNADGLDIEYATAWSYGINEMPNLLIPSFNGEASACSPRLKDGATEKLLRRAGQPNVKETVKALPMYWGPQPFTAGPMYLGAVTIFLFVLGLILLKGKDRIWIAIASVIAVFLAWGNHFMWFTELWFRYAPMYSKFRTVSMALTVLQVTVPLLGFLCVDKIIKEEIDKKRIMKALWWAFGIVGGFCLLFALFPSLAGSFTSAEKDRWYADVLVDAFKEDRMAMLRNDALRSLLFVTVTAAILLWAFKAKEPFAAKGRLYISGVCIVAVVWFDMFSVGRRYLNSDHFISPKKWEAQFRERPVDKLILRDKDLSYRVLDLSVSTFNDAHQCFRHKCIGGYSPIKMQRYQDLIERYISPEIDRLGRLARTCGETAELEENFPYLPVISMLNGRYVIPGGELIPSDGDLVPALNPYAFGNCWFVDGFRLEETVNGEFNALATTDLRTTAVLGPDFRHIEYVKPEMLSDDDYIELTSYEPNELHYECGLSGERAVVFSEIYYPSGWKAWIGPKGGVGQTEGSRFVPSENAVAAELFRADWTLRGMTVPEGEWEIVMRFEPESYIVGEKISLASSLTLILLVLLSGGFAIVCRRRAA